MKSLILFVLLATTGFGVFAQKLDKVKDHLKANKLNEAKTEVENFLAVEKNKNNSEGWYQKAKVYTAISKDSSLKATVPNAREVAYEALIVISHTIVLQAILDELLQYPVVDKWHATIFVLISEAGIIRVLTICIFYFLAN